MKYFIFFLTTCFASILGAQIAPVNNKTDNISQSEWKDCIDMSITDEKIMPWILTMHQNWSNSLKAKIASGEIIVFDFYDKPIALDKIPRYFIEEFKYGDKIIATYTTSFHRLRFFGDTIYFITNPDPNLYFKAPIKDVYGLRDSIIRYIHNMGKDMLGMFYINKRDLLASEIQIDLFRVYNDMLRQVQSKQELLINDTIGFNMDSFKNKTRHSEEFWLKFRENKSNILYPYISVRIGFNGISNNNQILGIGPSIYHTFSDIEVNTPLYFIHRNTFLNHQVIYYKILESIIDERIREALESD